jgi:hypothetical protein
MPEEGGEHALEAPLLRFSICNCRSLETLGIGPVQQKRTLGSRSWSHLCPSAIWVLWKKNAPPIVVSFSALGSAYPFKCLYKHYHMHAVKERTLCKTSWTLKLLKPYNYLSPKKELSVCLRYPPPPSGDPPSGFPPPPPLGFSVL